jgi:dynein heavy chain
MARTFGDLGEARYEECTKPKEYKKLVFALAYFHAAILERRKYGAIGWNIAYQWMNSDFDISEQQLVMYLNEQPEVPYAALNYLTAQVNYGGRVTDDKDIRLINAMLKKYYCPEIMNDGYKLSKLETYYAPPEGSLEDTLNYISGLPLDEDPEVFGLHSNANMAYEFKLVGEFTDAILVLQPRVSGGSAARTPEQIVQAMAVEFRETWPDNMEPAKAHAATFAATGDGTMNSLGVFVGQELARFNKLLSVIRKQLDDLNAAILGTVVMSQDLEQTFGSFLDGKVPEQWLSGALGYPSLKPLGSWMADLLARVAFMSDWLYNGPPKAFWLPCFFFPQGFMTATLQTYARATQTAIDTLAFKTNVCPLMAEAVTEGPEVGVNIHGLFMQGAKWDFGKACVEDSDPKIALVRFPVIWLEPFPTTDLSTEGTYACPLYKTSVRAGELSTTGHSTNFVLFLALPSKQHGDYWVRRGAALLCMTDT